MGDAFIDEPQRQLLGQLAHRKLLGQAQGCLRAWPALRNPGASKAGHHELDGLLQLAQIAFQLGLSQPYAIRETLVRGTAQKSRVSRELRTPQNRGNITKMRPDSAELPGDTLIIAGAVASSRG